MADSAELNLLDELYLHLNRDDEPWSVHLEVQAEGSIDPARLEDAVRAAALRHPIARARLAPTRATDVRYRWEIADELEDVPLEVTGEDAAGARERLLSALPALDRPGPFTLGLVRGADGDSLILNLVHAAGDGMAALRLMASILRAYSGQDDPAPAVDPLAVRDIKALVGSQSIAERLKRSRAAVGYMMRGLTPPVRVAPDGASDRPGYGFELLELEPDEVKQVSAQRTGGATVNDVLLGALGVTIGRWNERHGETSGTAYLMMPINLRPPEWRFDVVGNFASYVSVHLGADEQVDMESAVAAAAERTRRIKDDGVAGLIVDLFEIPTAMPTALKRRLQQLIPLTNNLVVDTAVLSNLGKLEDVPDLGDAGRVRAVWFSPPGRMPLGVSLGAASLDGRLFLTLRYRHPQFGPEAAAEFAALYRRTLLG
ncbi:MAG: hypothetical protein QOJ07_1221 [Thermoleophilaceae bacterium]|nr:hypothetical protein [Thermoleophilaceae bacterium]